MAETEGTGGLKRFLSELSSVLINNTSDGAQGKTFSESLEENQTELNTYNLSRNVFEELPGPTKNKQRKLRVTEDVVIVAENENFTLPEPEGTHFDEENDNMPLFVQDSSFSADIDAERDDGAYNGDDDDDDKPVIDAEQGGRGSRDLDAYRISTNQLRHLTASFLHWPSSSKKFTLPSKSTEELRIIIDEFIESLAKKIDFMLNNRETKNLDKQTILKVFSQFGMVNGMTTNQELFEVCKPYLNLEDLTDLEISLFS
ncbi:unnamed protein product [Kluyveromyces dobzhanskii CBS 2104]|uniref:WGS project CCBQ000000000 data, contig 00028 n=1 Tax=Kluyveromyces dobzhanskii CBS 2104 TaxID=1427455 RepID=A0A0A8KYY5_9SACH|nr:unnamed protein product [Kluyveromyces dobzhanskii CBS 2104]